MRISWLVLARNALLARLAASAASRAAARAGVEPAPLGDVVGDPDGAAVARPHRVDRLAEDAAPEPAAVAPAHLALDLERLPGAEQRAGDAADLGVVVGVGPDHRAGLADDAADVPAEDGFPARVRLHEAAVAGEGDADRGALEDHRVLEAGALGDGHVARIDDHVGAAVHLETGRRDEHRGELAAARAQHRRHLADAAALLHGRAQMIAVAHVVPQAELGGGAAHHFAAGIAGEPAEGGVDHRVPAACELGQGDEVGAGRDQVREHRFGAA